MVKVRMSTLCMARFLRLCMLSGSTVTEAGSLQAFCLCHVINATQRTGASGPTDRERLSIAICAVGCCELVAADSTLMGPRTMHGFSTHAHQAACCPLLSTGHVPEFAPTL